MWFLWAWEFYLLWAFQEGLKSKCRVSKLYFLNIWKAGVETWKKTWVWIFLKTWITWDHIGGLGGWLFLHFCWLCFNKGWYEKTEIGAWFVLPRRFPDLKLGPKSGLCWNGKGLVCLQPWGFLLVKDLGSSSWSPPPVLGHGSFCPTSWTGLEYLSFSAKVRLLIFKDNWRGAEQLCLEHVMALDGKTE